MRARNLLLLLWSICTLTVRGATFDSANQLYDAGRFAEASDEYESLVKAGERSANLFYNLGNTEFRLSEPGVAMLDYERTLSLDPSHPEARANLTLLRGQTGAMPWPDSVLDHVFPGRIVDIYAIVAACAGWLAVSFFVAILLTSREEKSGLWFGTVAALAVAAYCAVAVWHFEKDRNLAVVTVKTAEVRLEPAESSTEEAQLPAGSEVRVLSERGDWIYCVLPSHNRGWIAIKSLERVRLEDS